MKSKTYEMDMCSGSILKKMLLFALPLMLSGILQLLFNAADIIVVGNFAGDKSMHSLAAVGSTSSLINLLTNVFIGLSVGSNVLVARFFWRESDQGVKRNGAHLNYRKLDKWRGSGNHRFYLCTDDYGNDELSAGGFKTGLLVSAHLFFRNAGYHAL